MHEERTPNCEGCASGKTPARPYALIGRSTAHAGWGRVLCDHCARQALVNSILIQGGTERDALAGAWRLLERRNEYASFLQQEAERNLELARADADERRAQTKRLVSPRKRMDILRRDGFKCGYCGRDAENDHVKLHVDHMQPVTKGGSNDDENLWTLCFDCNIGKSNRL